MMSNRFGFAFLWFLICNIFIKSIFSFLIINDDENGHTAVYLYTNSIILNSSYIFFNLINVLSIKYVNNKISHVQ